MIIDSRNLPDGEAIEADVCIIGGGAAGIAIARAFAGKRLRVCLLESGGLRMDRETQQLYAGENVGLPYELDTTRTRYFGGSTNCWAGFSRPFEDFHFQRRTWIPESGWPIDAAVLQPYYARASEALGIEADAYDPQQVLPSLPGHDLRPLPLPDGPLVTSLTRLSKERRCFGKAHRAELAASANVRIYLHANALELLLSADCQRIVAVRAATLSGKRLQASARIFILATGAIENARLLLVSDGIQTTGIGNAYDNVGRYFMEHPRTVVAEVKMSTDAERATRAYLPRYAMLRLPVAAELNVAYRVQQAERLADAAAYVELVLQGEDAPSTLAFKELFWDVWRGVRPRAPLRQLRAILSSPVGLARFGWGLFTCSEAFIRCRRISLISEQVPNRDSRVMLALSRDRLGMRQVRLDWRMTEIDRRSLRRTTEIVSGALAAAGLLQVAELMPAHHTDVLTPQWNWHHMGTTRMHDDPRQGVVDRNCRVHGVGNLFIAGSSVFPTAGNHTPTFTILALALRLADHVLTLVAGPSAGRACQPAALRAASACGNAVADGHPA